MKDELLAEMRDQLLRSQHLYDNWRITLRPGSVLGVYVITILSEIVPCFKLGFIRFFLHIEEITVFPLVQFIMSDAPADVRITYRLDIDSTTVSINPQVQALQL